MPFVSREERTTGKWGIFTELQQSATRLLLDVMQNGKREKSRAKNEFNKLKYGEL